MKQFLFVGLLLYCSTAFCNTKYDGAEKNFVVDGESSLDLDIDAITFDAMYGTPLSVTVYTKHIFINCVAVPTSLNNSDWKPRARSQL